MRKILLGLAILASFFSIQAQSLKQNIIPIPVSAVSLRSNYSIDNNTKIIFDASQKLDFEAKWLKEKIVDKYGINLQISNDIALLNANSNIRFIVSDTAKWCEKEGHHININQNGIEIIAQTQAGIFMGLQTIMQILPQSKNDNKLVVSGIKISDKPSYQWRGLNLDCCRHFMEKDFVIRYIDLLAMHKMNTLHWHLTEDQAWRIEIKKYPLLTKIGAWRTMSDGSIYGGFYTQEDVREVVEYARQRHINVVPEIEMPGHAVAALASYPHLSCTGGPFEVERQFGVFDDIYCAGNDEVFTFLKNVIDEVLELFPSEYIHIGGDEAPKVRWEKCPKCQKRIKDENLKDEFELQSWFINQMNDYLTSKGRRIIGWDEILEGGADKYKGVTVQSWRGFEGAQDAAASENFAIVSPTTYCYFDGDVAHTTLKTVYSFDLIPEGLAPEHHHRIIGSEACMWTEYAPQHTIDSKLFPRIVALAEVLWSPKENRNWDNFKTRLETHYLRLNELGVKYGFERSPMNLEIKSDMANKGFICTIVPGQDGLSFTYAFVKNGKTDEFKKYEKPVFTSDASGIEVKIFNALGEESGTVSRNFSFHKAAGKTIKINTPYAEQYAAGGNNNLIDGMKGTDNFRDLLWQGYTGTDVEVIIDMEQKTEISKVSTSTFQSTLAWIFHPTKVDVYLSNNGKKWKKAGEALNKISERNSDNTIQEFSVEFKKQKIRYIKLVAKSIGQCPEWHRGAGHNSWIFMDEIEVE